MNRKQRRKDVSMIRKKRYDYKTVTIKEWIRDYLKQTDHQPVGQRLPVDYTNAKSIDIIESLVDGKGIGMLTLVKENNEFYVYESIDGGHRKRALRDFLQDDFEVYGKKFSEFTDEETKDFMKIEIQLHIYYDLTNDEKGALFRTINNSTKVKHQEMLNSYGDISIANAVRETVRVISGCNNEIHSLFTKDGDVGCKMKYLSAANLQLKQEEFLSRVFYTIWRKKFTKENEGKFVGAVNDDNLKSMFKNMSKKEVDTTQKIVDELLGFLKEMAIARNNIFQQKLSWKEQVSLTHLFFWMKDTFGVFKIADYDKFFKEYNTVYEFIDDNNTLVDLPFEKKELTISVNFSNYTKEWASKDKINQMLTWITDEFNFTDTEIFTQLDIQRLFPKKMKEKQLTKQGYRCYIDGLPLTMEEAEAAHIEAWSSGGRTTENNIAMVRKKYNRDMGVMNLHQWMVVNDFERKVA